MSEPFQLNEFGVEIMTTTKKLILAAIVAAVLPDKCIALDHVANVINISNRD